MARYLYLGDISSGELASNSKFAHTTLGTLMGSNIYFHTIPVSVLDNIYNNPNIVPHSSSHFALSRAKMDTFEQHLPHINDEDGKNVTSSSSVVWIDLDTIIFHKSAIVNPGPWVYGYQGMQGKNDCLGDMWSLTHQAIKDVRDLEQNLVKNNPSRIPKYDLQGYYSRILDMQDNRNKNEFVSSSPSNDNKWNVVQDLHPEFAFGFYCTLGSHPKLDKIGKSIKSSLVEEVHLDDNESNTTKTYPKVTDVTNSSSSTKITCRGKQIASLSFTASTYHELFLGGKDNDSKIWRYPTFDAIVDVNARRWLNDFFYNPSHSITSSVC